VNVRGKRNVTMQIVTANVAAAGDAVTVQGEGSLDGTSYGAMAPKNNAVTSVTITGGSVQIDASMVVLLQFENVVTDWVRLNWTAEAGGATDATVDVKIEAN
jgi:hypothetical protein